MKLVIGNTFLHQLERILSSDKSIEMTNYDALSLFHIAEHIMFSDDIIVTNYFDSFTEETTDQAVDLLDKMGVTDLRSKNPFINVKKLKPSEYAELCIDAGWNMAEDLTVISPEDLFEYGRLVNRSSLPSGFKIPFVDDWLTKSDITSEELLAAMQNKELRGSAHLEYMVRSCAGLRRSLLELSHNCNGFNAGHSVAIIIMMRLHINQEIARQNDRLYSTSPQRSMIAASLSRLFRHKVENLIEENVFDNKHSEPSALIDELRKLENLPLPYFALYMLRNNHITHTKDIIDASMKMRNNDMVKEVRKWLSKWEARVSSEDSSERLKAANYLDEISSEIKKQLNSSEQSIVSNMQPGIDLSFDPVTGSPTWSFGLPKLNEVWRPLKRKFDNQRIFVAAVARTIATDKNIGGIIIRAINE